MGYGLEWGVYGVEEDAGVAEEVANVAPVDGVDADIDVEAAGGCE